MKKFLLSLFLIPVTYILLAFTYPAVRDVFYVKENINILTYGKFLEIKNLEDFSLFLSKKRDSTLYLDEQKKIIAKADTEKNQRILVDFYERKVRDFSENGSPAFHVLVHAIKDGFYQNKYLKLSKEDKDYSDEKLSSLKDLLKSAYVKANTNEITISGYLAEAAYGSDRSFLSDPGMIKKRMLDVLNTQENIGHCLSEQDENILFSEKFYQTTKLLKLENFFKNGKVKYLENESVSGLIMRGCSFGELLENIK